MTFFRGRNSPDLTNIPSCNVNFVPLPTAFHGIFLCTLCKTERAALSFPASKTKTNLMVPPRKLTSAESFSTRCFVSPPANAVSTMTLYHTMHSPCYNYQKLILRQKKVKLLL